jgi:hypothetical protein
VTQDNIWSICVLYFDISDESRKPPTGWLPFETTSSKRMSPEMTEKPSCLLRVLFEDEALSRHTLGLDSWPISTSDRELNSGSDPLSPESLFITVYSAPDDIP